MLNMLKILKNSLSVSLVFIGMGLAQQTHANCQRPESLFEQKDCQYQSYLQLQSELDSAHHLFVDKFIAQVKASGGDVKAAKTKLVQANVAWKKYVHADCALDFFLNPGNSAGQNQLACEVEHIQQRMKAIKEFQF